MAGCIRSSISYIYIVFSCFIYLDILHNYLKTAGQAQKVCLMNYPCSYAVWYTCKVACENMYLSKWTSIFL